MIAILITDGTTSTNRDACLRHRDECASKDNLKEARVAYGCKMIEGEPE